MGNPVMYESSSPTNLLRQWAARRTARQADYLAAPSRHMADMVSASTGQSCNVLPWGVDHSVFFPAPFSGDEILCVADFKAYKRQDLVVEAWLRLSAPRPGLRFVGNPDVDPRAHARLVRRIKELPDAASIRMDYRISHELMSDIYRRARVFVLPSEHESFCMPLAESMACGVPGVVRGIPSLRETGGRGATYLDGDDPAEWAAVITRMIEDNAEHDRARTLAMRAAARFTWEALAAELAAEL
jgi:glycosyltransferase involved in cell wall biosynthesis